MSSREQKIVRRKFNWRERTVHRGIVVRRCVERYRGVGEDET